MQDWGGPIGFRFAVENPDRVARLVVMNTGIGARAPNDEWLRFQAFMRRVDLDIVAGQLVRLSLVQPTSDEVIAAYDAPFPTRESRVGIAQFPELVATSADHPTAPKMLEVREALRSFDRPALVLFSDSDPIFSRRAAEVMAGAAAERRARSAARGSRALPAGRPRRGDRQADRRVAPLTGFIPRHDAFPYAGRGTMSSRSRDTQTAVPENAALGGPESL